MFENEDVILPDDYQESDLSQSEEVNETPVETELETNQTEQTEELVTEQNQSIPSTFKVKFNHEEQEIAYDEAVPLIQKGMNYDKQIERLQQLENDPRLNFVQELAEQFGMSTQEYIEAVRQEKEQQALNELVNNNIPEEYAREMLENRKFRQQFDSERKTKAEDEKKNAEFGDFLTHFKDSNGRDFDPQKDEIPANVWELTQQGIPLKFAYLEHTNKQLQSQLQTLKQNQENTKKAPVTSVTQHGSTEVALEDDFLRGFNSI